MEPNLRGSPVNESGKTKIYVTVGLAFLLWLTSVLIFYLWWRGYLRRTRPFRENGEVEDGQSTGVSHDCQTEPNPPVLLSAIQDPVTPPPLQAPRFHGDVQSVHRTSQLPFAKTSAPTYWNALGAPLPQRPIYS